MMRGNSIIAFRHILMITFYAVTLQKIYLHKHYIHKTYLHKKFILVYIQIKVLKKTILRSLFKNLNL